MYVLEEEKQKILVGVGRSGVRNDRETPEAKGLVVDLTKDDEERGTSSPIGDKDIRPHFQIAEKLGMGSTTYTKCKYVDKHGTEEQKKSLIQGKTSLDNIYKKISEEKRIEAQDGRRNITKFKYTEKEIRRNDLKLRNEAKERQKSNLNQFQTTDNQCSTVALNSARRDEDRSDRTNYTLAKNMGKLSSESFRLLKICSYYMQ